MAHGFYVITGTSRGIGEALARRLLDQGNTVLGVSRNRPATLDREGYHHLACDLGDPSGLDRITDRAASIAAGQAFEVICLVNNASATEPLGPMERCAAPAITAHVSIGLIAPMILTAYFIDRFADAGGRKIIAFISSGAAFHPMPDDSVYCASKAGLAMFAQCVGMEQSGRERGFEILSIGPGMVDTDMQQTARSRSREEFALAEFFQQAHAEGRLSNPDAVAEKICTLLKKRQEQGQYISVDQA